MKSLRRCQISLLIARAWQSASQNKETTARTELSMELSYPNQEDKMLSVWVGQDVAPYNSMEPIEKHSIVSTRAEFVFSLLGIYTITPHPPMPQPMRRW